MSKQVTKTEDIRLLRLSSQLLQAQKHHSPAAIVQHMGAMQAQDAYMVKLAVELRMKQPSLTAINEALDIGSILRTHILRPTWHYVAAEDLRWIMRITAPTIQTAMRAMDADLGLTPAVVKKSFKVIESALRNNTYLTREELGTVLASKGIAIDGRPLIHLCMRAETELLVCSGPMKGKKLTYALVDERVPYDKKFTKEEALYELALRYFTSHGPASLDDFRWWSGLRMPEVRTAVGSVKSRLQHVTYNGTELIYAPASTISKPSTPMLLPAFDEYLVSYKERKATLHPDHTRMVVTVNGIFRPVIIDQGKVIGCWKQTAGMKETLPELSFFVAPSARVKKGTDTAAASLLNFFRQT